MQLDWLDILYKVFEVAIIPILAAASLYLVALIKAKKQELLDKTKEEIRYLEDILSMLEFATNHELEEIKQDFPLVKINLPVAPQ